MKTTVITIAVLAIAGLGLAAWKFFERDGTDLTVCSTDRTGGVVHFLEQNLSGLQDGTDSPIEFTGKVLGILDHSKLLAEDPRTIPYEVYFEIVKGKIPRHPKAEKFKFLPQYKAGVESLERFKPSQEVIFVCSSDGEVLGMKNVPAFKELKNGAKSAPVKENPTAPAETDRAAAVTGSPR